MKYRLKDLIDIPKLQAFPDTLDEIHRLPSAIIDTQGNILPAMGRQAFGSVRPLSCDLQLANEQLQTDITKR